ncbi:nitroreductase family deazaflavin-dependent oxidoreductase [soil metagenome]
MQLPQWLARSNRYTTNRLAALFAGWMPMMGILEHVGRRSGKTYRTPLTVFSTADGVAILLTYGPDRDWLKNITATGCGRMKRHGKTVTLRDPHIVSADEAGQQIGGIWQRFFAISPFEKAVLLTRAS